jgi:hypothetical protein
VLKVAAHSAEQQRAAAAAQLAADERTAAQTALIADAQERLVAAIQDIALLQSALTAEQRARADACAALEEQLANARDTAARVIADQQPAQAAITALEAAAHSVLYAQKQREAEPASAVKAREDATHRKKMSSSAAFVLIMKRQQKLRMVMVDVISRQYWKSSDKVWAIHRWKQCVRDLNEIEAMKNRELRRSNVVVAAAALVDTQKQLSEGSA